MEMRCKPSSVGLRGLNSLASRVLATVEETEALASEFAVAVRPGDLVALEGELGVGKTTFVRGVLRAVGYDGPVRSPTFNLMQVYETTPPILHADLFRVASAVGIGLEDFFATHVSFIEWPDRASELFDDLAWRLSFSFDGDGRRVEIVAPSGRNFA